MPAFVVQEHHARRLHWDLRLEAGGVLKSWALPKGPTLDPEVKRLAIETADHDLAYGTYEGALPEGFYGAGRVLIWDRGDYELLEPAGGAAEGIRRGLIVFRLRGGFLKGVYSLVRLNRPPGRWLLVKRADRHVRQGWQPPTLLPRYSPAVS